MSKQETKQIINPKQCSNPFFNCLGRKEEQFEIHCDVIVNSEQFHICEKCWNKLATSNHEWGQPKTEEKESPDWKNILGEDHVPTPDDD